MLARSASAAHLSGQHMRKATLFVRLAYHGFYRARTLLIVKCFFHCINRVGGRFFADMHHLCSPKTPCKFLNNFIFKDYRRS